MKRTSLTTILAILWAGTATAEERMPFGQQNALVGKYCAVCHTDAAKNGGLSLQHFDAEHAAPSLTAMMLSKLTGGVSLATANAAPADKRAVALIDLKMKSGAMGAAGIPMPDNDTVHALIRAFTIQSEGATKWSVERGATVRASTLREAVSASKPGEAEFYRLTVSCNSATREGEMQLAWSPVPQRGVFLLSIDGAAGIKMKVEGSEKMGNHSGVVLDRPAFAVLALRTLPTNGLTISDLFPGESVTFPFMSLPKDARQELQTCFTGSFAAAAR